MDPFGKALLLLTVIGAVVGLFSRAVSAWEKKLKRPKQNEHLTEKKHEEG
jgi:hypothetical protein